MAEKLSSEGYVLHTRNYRETSLMVEVLTEKNGREGLIARGARSRGGAAGKRLQPFRCLYLDWQRRGELGTLKAVEELGTHRFSASIFGIGLYLNELIMRLLPRHQESMEIYRAYTAALRSFAAGLPVEPVLRSFELRLLDGLGYALPLEREIDTGQILEPNAYYRFFPDQGPRLLSDDGQDGIRGAALMAISREDWSEAETLSAAKVVLRRALEAQLGTYRLRTRRLLGGLARYRRMTQNDNDQSN
ncbi:DNA repair protein RecO [Acidihalobacter prosperus]